MKKGGVSFSGHTTKYIDEVYVPWKEDTKAVLISWQVCFGKMGGIGVQYANVRNHRCDRRWEVSYILIQRHSASARQAFCSRAAM